MASVAVGIAGGRQVGRLGTCVSLLLILEGFGGGLASRSGCKANVEHVGDDTKASGPPCRNFESSDHVFILSPPPPHVAVNASGLVSTRHSPSGIQHIQHVLHVLHLLHRIKDTHYSHNARPARYAFPRHQDTYWDCRAWRRHPGRCARCRPSSVYQGVLCKDMKNTKNTTVYRHVLLGHRRWCKWRLQPRDYTVARFRLLRVSDTLYPKQGLQLDVCVMGNKPGDNRPRLLGTGNYLGSKLRSPCVG